VTSSMARTLCGAAVVFALLVHAPWARANSGISLLGETSLDDSGPVAPAAPLSSAGADTTGRDVDRADAAPSTHVVPAAAAPRPLARRPHGAPRFSCFQLWPDRYGADTQPSFLSANSMLKFEVAQEVSFLEAWNSGKLTMETHRPASAGEGASAPSLHMLFGLWPLFLAR
jgi:hypothetical protein